MSLEEDQPRDREDAGVPALTYVADDRLTKLSIDLVMFAYKHTSGTTPVFPGPNPISMDIEHLDLVKFNDYVFSPKVDGVRYQLVVVDDQVSLVDRALMVLKPSFASLPSTWFLEPAGQPVPGCTVLDCEMVEDWLMVFDVVMIAGFRTMDTKLDYRSRLQLLEGKLGSLQFGPKVYNVVVKPIFNKGDRSVPALFDGKIPTDGLVFTPVAEPVRTFTHWHMFKVKSHHTIDLRLVCIPRTSTTHIAPPVASSLPEAIAKKIQPVILKNTISSIHVRKTPPKTLMSMIGTRPESSRPSAATLDELCQSRSSVTWVTRLEYTHGERSIDASSKGIEYSGKKLILKIKLDDQFQKLLAEVERAWRKVKGDVVCMSLVVECQLDIEDLASPTTSVNNVTFVRTRPDKIEPNSYKTITRTITSILYGVRPKHIEDLQSQI